MDFGLKNKRALVTGGTQGIGFAIARCLAEEGASVILASRSQGHIDSAVETLRKGKLSASGLVMDLTDESQIRSGMVKCLSEGGLDILVNNAGGPAAGSFFSLTLADWDQGYTSLIRSVVLLSQMVIPKMQERKWGRILTVTSTTAREIIPSLPVSGTFRAGLSAWVKSLAKDVGHYGILANNLLPGMTRTARLLELMGKDHSFFESRKNDIALGKFAEPEEIARVAAFLCSNANTYVTGTDILADGGYTSAF